MLKRFLRNYFLPHGKDATIWYRWQLRLLPLRKWDQDVGLLSAIIVIPARKKHDSGYRFIEVIGCRAKTGAPFCKLTVCSDVVHLDGIGGYGYKWVDKYGHCPDLIPPQNWEFDCLPRSGCFRFWANGLLRADLALSSFSIYSNQGKKGE